VAIAPFVPMNMMAAPAGATHFNLVAGGSAVDFEAQTYVADTVKNGVQPIDTNATTAITLNTNVGAASTVPLFLVLGIQFYQQINSQLYILKNGAYNALALVDVNGV
jgi:hypothetical protein